MPGDSAPGGVLVRPRAVAGQTYRVAGVADPGQVEQVLALEAPTESSTKVSSTILNNPSTRVLTTRM